MKIILIVAFLFIPLTSFSVPPVSLDAHGSYYESLHTTIDISSSSVTTITALPQPNDYREIYLKSPGSTTVVYYRIDKSTVSIPSVGYSFIGGDGVFLETSGPIYLQLGAGDSEITVRKVESKR